MPERHSRTALVTGCAGFLGSHLCEALLARGETVRGVDCFTSYYPRDRKERNLRAALGRPGFRLFERDLATDDLDDLLDGVDVVYHLAAQPGVRLSFGPGFALYRRDNVLATERLLAAASNRSLEAFVYASSSSVYGDQDVFPAREDGPVRPVSPYGATKVITEQLAGAFWQSAGVPVVGLRYFTVYGPRQRPDMAFSRFISRALAGQPLPVLGDGHQVREFTYVADVVAATIAAADRGEHGSVYNVGGGVPASLREVIARLEAVLGRELPVVHAPTAQGDPRRTEADIGRAQRDLGYAPATGLDAGLAAQVSEMSATSDRDALAAVATPVATGTRRVVGAPRGERPPRVLAYSHDGYGLGHLRRNLRLTSALRRRRPNAEIVIATGAPSAERLTARFGVECVALPPVSKTADGRRVAAGDATVLSEIVARRSALLTATVERVRPDLMLVDRYPAGMHDELLPALDLARTLDPAPVTVLGLRDILDAPPVVAREWAAGRYTETILDRYETVLCYGDRLLFDPVAEYGLPDEVAARVSFTGYLADDLLAASAAEIRRRHAFDGHLAVCTLGGGKDAAPIARAFTAAINRCAADGWRGVLIAGPHMAPEDLAHVRAGAGSGSVAVMALVDDVPSYLAAADVAVCMGGYNTCCEVIGLAVPAVVIPRVAPRVEQLMRAERLAGRGLVRLLHPDELSAERLADEMTRAATRSRPALAARVSEIAHHGVASASEQLAGLLAAAVPEDGRHEEGAGLRLATGGRP